MSNSLLDSILVKTDVLFERIFHRREEKETISFRNHLTDPRRILFIPGESPADLVLLSDFIKATLRKFSQAKIHILVPREQACLFENIPRVIASEYSNRSSHPFEANFRRVAANLQQENFDWAVNLSFNAGRAEALITYHSGAKIHTGVPTPETERYYNLVIKKVPDEQEFRKRFSHLFRVLQVELPSKHSANLIRLTDEELDRGAKYVRLRKSRRRSGGFIACVPEWRATEKTLVRNLQKLLERLTSSLDPTRLMVAANLAPEEQISKWENISAYVHNFANLRNMLSSLAACDKVVTNSVGVACLLGSFDVKVGLIPTDEENISRMSNYDLKNIRIIRHKKDRFPLNQAEDFAHQGLDN
jgi:ADP-heptose:LPS heptosyltransferase